jgi:hypothetical protein
LFTTVLPTAMAGMMRHVAMISGQFHGVIEPTTPIALRWSSIRPSLLSWSTLTGIGMSAVWWVQACTPPSSNRDPMPLSGLPPGQLLGVFADFLSRGMTQRATLGVGHFRPFGERRARCRDCAIEIGRCCNWCQADDCAG